MTKDLDPAPSTTLVEVEGCPGLALVFGTDVPAGVDLVTPTLFPTTAADSATGTISTLIGAGNIAAQAGTAAAGLQGLVRLTPETLNALQTATPLTNAAGANLGTLVDAGGKFAHSVQWVPAGAAGAVQVAASLGPAIALLMIQMQLKEISSLVRENIALTDELLQTVKREQWAEVDGLHEAMLKAIEEAQHVGHVTEHIWENVSGHEAELRKARTMFRGHVANHRAKLAAAKDHRARAEYLTHHAEEIVTDGQALIRAQAAWFTYQAIRAGRVYADPNEPDSLLEKIVENARTEHHEELAEVDKLLHQLHWQCSVLADLPGKRTVMFTKSRRAAGQVARVSKVLVEQVAALRESIREAEPAVPSPRIVAFADEVPEHINRVLRWHLGRDEELLAIADTKTKFAGRSYTRYLAVTDEHLFVLKKEEFDKHGDIAITVDLEDLRYVRFRPGDEKTRGRLDLFTPQIDLSHEFGSWAAQEDNVDSVRKVADLLASSMNLPASEVPTSPIARSALLPSG